uniref:Uncharacterized protein n=1 Tax=Setaria italica TaxID=4555 RepID=K4AKA5_SETIT
MRVKDLLAQQGISRALHEKKPAKVEDDKWEEMQVQACATIRLCLSDQIMYHVMDESPPKKEGSDLAEHMNIFNQLIVDLGKVDVNIDDEDMAIVLLCSYMYWGYERSLISLGILHEEGWLYQAAPDKKTLRVMHGSKMVMVGEKSNAHQYKLKGSVVEGGVMGGNATMAVFYPDVGKVATASSGCSK